MRRIWSLQNLSSVLSNFPCVKNSFRKTLDDATAEEYCAGLRSSNYAIGEIVNIVFAIKTG
jgi:hypothetical protein